MVYQAVLRLLNVRKPRTTTPCSFRKTKESCCQVT
jgi:hypothetical protein